MFQSFIVIKTVSHLLNFLFQNSAGCFILIQTSLQISNNIYSLIILFMDSKYYFILEEIWITWAQNINLFQSQPNSTYSNKKYANVTTPNNNIN